MFGLLLVVGLLILLNAFFVLMEYALVRVRSSRIEMLARKGSARALSVQGIQGHLDQYLAAVQVGITLIALALGWLGEPFLGRGLDQYLQQHLSWALPHKAILVVAFSLALAGLASIQIVFGELVPRAIALQKAESITLLGAAPLRLFALVFRLPAAFMSFSSVSILKFLGFKPAAEAESVVSEEEMRVLLGETQEKGALPLERLLLLENLFDFGSAKVSEAMIPRERVVALSLSKPWEDNLEIIRGRRFSRYPLCENGLDSVIGMIHVKDLLLKAKLGQPGELKRLRREIAEVLETDPLEKLVKYFPDKGIHMAVVRNGLGHVSGILTLEDIIEELIGEVHDEFDLPEAWSLVELVQPSCVAINLQAPDRRSAISQLLSRLAAATPELKEAEAFQAVWEREMKFSSAVGRGVAVPHGRLLSLAGPLVALGRFVKPASFPAPDNIPVRLVFLILTPASTPVIQLKVLGRIASLVTNENLRRRLLRAKTAESMLEILRTADTLLAA